MSTQTTETSVTFVHSFTLSSVDGVQPAGTYHVVAHEHQRAGLPFQTVKRLTMLLHLPACPEPGRAGQVVRVDPAELADALAADAA
jgi:hypothetical protein